MISRCRICKNSNLKNIMDLGDHCLSCRFPYNFEPDPISCPLILLKCDDANNSECCGLVQLKHNVSSDELYMHNYGYRSGLNNTMINHLAGLASECLQKVTIFEDDCIVDIGSNDATLLKSYNLNCTKVGIDPTGNQFKQYYTSDIKLIPDFFSANVFYNSYSLDKKAKIITSISMFYDLPDPVQFMKDVKKILAHDGIWVTEQSYIVTMLERNSFDTICHEHLEYYAFKQIEFMANMVGLKVIDVTLNDCNGGSFRTTLSHIDSKFESKNENINKLKEIEQKLQLNTEIPYNNFRESCEIVRKNLCKFIQDMKESGKNIYLYGASTKGNTLLQYFNIDNKLITAAAERNVEKYGRRTPKTDIPIISEKEMRDANPHFLLVLPWHFKEEFVTRENDYLNQGGQLLFPLPKFELISNKKKAFITGVNGQIGHYLAEILLSKDYIVYGLLHNNKEIANTKINYVYGDLNDVEFIKQMIETILPDEFYNLGGETDTIGSINKPVECFDINARILFTICETIKNTKKNIKLFQANSAELYKGLLNGETLVVNEETLGFHPITPYSIAKLASYWTIRYYREKFNFYGCNGMIFTTESPYRNNRYLSKKVTNFVKNMKDGDILEVGNLNCCRDWLHAKDAANGIYLLMQQEKSDDYIISSNTSNTIRKLIELSFKEKNIELEWKEKDIDEIAVNRENQKIVLKVNPSFIRPFEKKEDLVGDNSKLRSIGWNPEYDLEKIIREMMN